MSNWDLAPSYLRIVAGASILFALVNLTVLAGRFVDRQVTLLGAGVAVYLSMVHLALGIGVLARRSWAAHLLIAYPVLLVAPFLVASDRTFLLEHRVAIGVAGLVWAAGFGFYLRLSGAARRFLNLTRERMRA
jgi:hypothetical protein